MILYVTLVMVKLSCRHDRFIQSRAAVVARDVRLSSALRRPARIVA